VWPTDTCSADSCPVWSKTVQPRKKTSLDQRAACQHDVVIPTLDLANGTGDNYKFVALSVPLVPSTLQPTLSPVAHCFGRVSLANVGAIIAACSCKSFAVGRGEFWCIKGTQSEETHQFDVRIDHGVSAWFQIVRSEVPTRGRPRPNENCRLWILCASSIPAIVTAALANDLKPRMGPHLCLIAR
jgi:hypothetical protein